MLLGHLRYHKISVRAVTLFRPATQQTRSPINLRHFKTSSYSAAGGLLTRSAEPSFAQRCTTLHKGKRQNKPRSFLSMSALAGDTFFLDEFAFRQFEGGHAGQLDIPKEEFVQKVHELFKGKELVDGYAPFCKHIFVPNFTNASVNALEITEENESLVRTGYSQRRPDELAVLTRWFPKEKVEAHKAKFLDIILYSREQIEKEYSDKPTGAEKSLPDAPWGIISVKPQDEDHETPMQPITVMRNSLGRSEGGSGVPLDKKAYEASVDYWRSRATIIAGSPAGE